MFKRLIFLLLLAVAVATKSRANVPLPADAPSFTPKEVAQGYRDGVLIVKPHARHRSSVDAEETREGCLLRQRFARLGDMRVIENASGETTEEAIARLRASGRYEFVEPDRILRAFATPNDPSFGQQWSLSNTGQDGGVAGADIGARAAWDIVREAPDVIVAILDTGLRLTHGDLAGNLWTNPSPSSSGYTNDVHGINALVPKGLAGSGNPTDDNGHGTHVAGIIGAIGNNSLGVSGVAWKVRLMPLKFLRADGSGVTSANIACLDYAIANGVAIINASYGSTVYSAAEFDALKRVRDAGIIVVTAAGNDGMSNDVATQYPAGYLLDNIVAVASTTRADVPAGNSNYGAGSVDLAAPGDSITSTYASSDDAYRALSGTSMATPHVVGALALLKARYPSDNYRQLINRLLHGAARLPALGGKVQTGRLNIAHALEAASSAPFNDDFAQGALLAGTTARVRTSNVGGTTEPGEPAHAGVTGGASLWWRWTAPEGGTVTFDAGESAYTPAVAVYTGAALSVLEPAASGATSATLHATAGTTYHVAVTGADGGSGLTVLKLRTVPANDSFATAHIVEGVSVRVDTTTVNASREAGEPTITGVPGGHSLWFRWTAPAAGRFLLSAFSSETDTLAAVYTGTSLAGLTLVAANNNSSASNSDALAVFTATAGTTYFFQIDNTNTNGGAVTITLTDALWAFPTNDEVTSSPAVGSDGTIVFGSTDGYVYAVNPDGTLKWRAPTGGAVDIATPAIGPDGTVYIGSTDGILYALDGATGARKWRYLSTSSLYGAPAIGADGTVYFRDDNTLHAVTSGTTNATRQWTFPLSGGTYSSPVIDGDGTIYVGATGGAFYAVNPDGTQKWKFTGEGDIYTSAAIGADGVIYFATLTGKVYALLPSGAQKWSWQLSAPANSITSSVALGADGTIYFAAYDAKLHALRSDGSEKWAFSSGSEVRASSPAIAADGTIYFGAYDGYIYAVKPDGSLLRRFATGARVRSSPVLANGRLSLGSGDGKLYTFNLGQNPAASAWPMYRQNAGRTGRISSAGITITAQPVSQFAVLGSSLALRVAATAKSALGYQWYKDGVAIPGATSATYTIEPVTGETAGAYTAVITSGAGSVTSTPAVVTVGATAEFGHLVNLSVRAPAGSGAQTLIVGFAVSGDKRLLVRGIGPTLTAYGVNAALPDPSLALYASTGTALEGNDNWDGNAALSATFDLVGAFALSPTSKDAALLRELAAGSYTAHITTSGSETGAALAEIYDANRTAGGHLTNISGRAHVGGETLIAGFVISGNMPKKVLIRAAGPALGGFGVTGTLTDPKLELYQGNALAESNNDWGANANRADLAAVAQQVGAFAFDDGSKDAALLVTLMPGAYTAIVGSATDGTGVALVEVYEVP